MRVNKVNVIAVAIGVAAVGAIGFGVSSAGADTRPDRTVVVDGSIPNHDLLDDVRTIEAARANGSLAFSYVPRTRPAGLERMLPAGTVDGHILDGYHVGAQPAQVFVEFAAQQTATCDNITGDPGSGLCLRRLTLAGPADDPQVRNVTIYLSQVGLSAPSAGDPATAEFRKFWSAVELVPVAEAEWFTALVAEAAAAPKTVLG